MLKDYDLDNINTNLTLLVEIVYPENKIIVDYGSDRKLILLTVFESDTEKELPWSMVKKAAEYTNMDLVKEFKNSTIEEIIRLQSDLPPTREGFVVRFENGERVKIKGKEYLKIARILSGCSPLAFWESMKSGKVSKDLIISIPEELRPHFESTIEELENKYKTILIEIEEDWKKVLSKTSVDEPDFRKKLGLYIQGNHELKHPIATFSRFLGKDLEKYVMKKIRPKANQL
jgi:RNA ligase